MANFDLISNILCPYTQRAGIQLHEKGVDFTRTYIDLADKPDWFLALSPLGKVPVLRHGETAIFETAVICEYIEETKPAPLHPAEPLKRARHRAWCEFASASIADIYMFYTARDEETFRRKAADLAKKMAWTDRHLGEGPFFAGERFSLVDAAYAPIFRLFDTFDRMGDFGIFDGLGKLPAWRQALAGRASVRDAVVADYARHFETYLAGQNSWLSGRMVA
jgi:glutathione S-transferase